MLGHTFPVTEQRHNRNLGNVNISIHYYMGDGQIDITDEDDRNFDKTHPDKFCVIDFQLQ